MLQLKNIIKDYVAGSSTVEALRGVNVQFRDSEFVTILGPSGCGKTTLLNILGGLDRYSHGDLIINGKSTKCFTSGDWDTYRNRSIGFVFQTYNLIQHQSVLRNVELALTLSGVTRAKRRKQAAQVLARVGLSDQMHKRPNQLSGGQMQRVAIARALVNNPDILLADEPTGALDSETSLQVMEILKEIAQDRLVIMVTHNQDLAERYATRVITLLDGEVTGDSDPYYASSEDAENAQRKRHQQEKEKKKTSMSFLTAISLSLNNLMTKKARTFLTAFAGSIGIIGIALILALSTGFQRYIDRIQQDTLSTYPIVINEKTADIDSLLSTLGEGRERAQPREREPDIVYSKNRIGNMAKSMSSGTKTNDLKDFKAYIEENKASFSPLVNAVSYGYDVTLNLFKPDTENGVVQVNPASFMQSMMPGAGNAEMLSSLPIAAGSDAFTELLDNQELLASQYDVVAGRWPEAKDEMVLVIDEDNGIVDYSLYALGLKDPAELEAMMKAIATGETFETERVQFTYDELLSLSYKFLPSAALYQRSDQGWVSLAEDEEAMKTALEDALELRIVGILRPAPDAQSTAISGVVGYTSALTRYVIEMTNESKIVKEQLAQPEVDVFSGAAFGQPMLPSLEAIQAMIPEEMRGFLANMTEEQLLERAKQYMPAMPTNTRTYEENLKTLGVVSEDSPSSISLFPVDFESKDAIDALIKAYNDKVTEAGDDQKTITYTDLIGLMMSSVSTIISGISYVLIAFVAISLVVSSIMIGIITYVSVLERTKEIGILKSIGASRRDISRVFNAETLIVGLVAGLIGIGATVLLTIPINKVIEGLIGVAGLAKVSTANGAVLITLSTGLTMIAGLIPSRLAARKDPVVALRTE